MFGCLAIPSHTHTHTHTHTLHCTALHSTTKKKPHCTQVVMVTLRAHQKRIDEQSSSISSRSQCQSWRPTSSNLKVKSFCFVRRTHRTQRFMYDQSTPCVEKNNYIYLYLDTPSYSIEWEGVSKLLTGTIYIYIYIHIHIYIIYTYTYGIYIHIHIRYIHTYIHIHAHTYTCIYIYISC